MGPANEWVYPVSLELARPEADDALPARERILAAAEQVFADLGFDGASVRQIATRAAVPIGLVSYHFGGKLGAYRAVFERRTPAVVEQRRAGLALAELEDDPDRRLALVVKAVLVPMLNLRTGEGRGSFGTLLAREVADPKSVERGIIQSMLDPVAQSVIEQLHAVLPGRTDAQVHWAYQAMIGTMVFVMADAGRIKRLSGGAADPEDADAAVRHLLPLLLDGLRGRKGSIE